MQLIFIDDIKDKDKLIKIAIRNKVDQYIKWTGLISQEQIADILRRSHVLISASRIETFGTAIVEGQACGLPVIASRTDGASYILSSPEQGIVVNTNDIKSLSEAMVEMFTNYKLYSPAKIPDNVSKFMKETVIEQWKEIYHNIAR
jgi:glycosyltransferase involved in cell wall biosynthesis